MYTRMIEASQTWWRGSQPLRHDSFAVKWLDCFDHERACSERTSSPRYLTRGAQKNKR